MKVCVEICGMSGVGIDRWVRSSGRAWRSRPPPFCVGQ